MREGKVLSGNHRLERIVDVQVVRFARVNPGQRACREVAAAAATTGRPQ